MIDQFQELSIRTSYQQRGKWHLSGKKNKTWRNLSIFSLIQNFPNLENKHHKCYQRPNKKFTVATNFFPRKYSLAETTTNIFSQLIRSSSFLQSTKLPKCVNETVEQIKSNVSHLKQLANVTGNFLLKTKKKLQQIDFFLAKSISRQFRHNFGREGTYPKWLPEHAAEKVKPLSDLCTFRLRKLLIAG